jgi:hypothetical protein
VQLPIGHHDSMVTPAVWVSTTTAHISAHTAHGPGDHWQPVGTIDTGQETEFSKHIKVMLNLRSTSPVINDFYLSGDPESAWVQLAKRDPSQQQPFWIAIDPYDQISRHDPADSGKYFVSTEMATVVASLARRPPEPHPGKLAKPVMIPIRLTRSPAGLFTAASRPEQNT